MPHVTELRFNTGVVLNGAGMFLCFCFYSGKEKNVAMYFSQQVAKTLKNTESLKVCHHCGSPSKYDSHLQRAICIRESCGFDFCTKCLCSYHSAKDCATGNSVKPTSKLGALPGTKKSKQNLWRL